MDQRLAARRPGEHETRKQQARTFHGDLLTRLTPCAIRTNSSRVSASRVPARKLVREALSARRSRRPSDRLRPMTQTVHPPAVTPDRATLAGIAATSAALLMT